MAAHSLHARVTDPSDHTAPARKAFNDRFEKQVDPDGILSPQDRARRAEHARKAFFLALALKSAKARRKTAETVARKSTKRTLATDATSHAGAPKDAA
jgi:hypothetical protein